MKTKASEIKIGDKLYRHVTMKGIWDYEVIERRDNKEGSQFVVRSLQCNHGWKCELLIGYDDVGDLRYIRMTNNHEDDDQHYWHINEGRFCTTIAQAKIDVYESTLSHAREDVQKAKDRLAYEQKRVDELLALIEAARRSE